MLIIVLVATATCVILYGANTGNSTRSHPSVLSTIMEPLVDTPKAQIDSSDWALYSDSVMGISFKYPKEVNNEAILISLYSSDDSSGGRYYEKQAHVDAETTAMNDSGEMVKVGGSVVFGIMAYAEGSVNDEYSRDASYSRPEYEVVDKVKKVTVNGVDGVCTYFSYTRKNPLYNKRFECEFQRDRLFYHVYGGAMAPFEKKFPDIDFWSTGLEILESLQFITS